MKRIKGHIIEEAIEIADAPITNLRAVERQVDVAYKRWLIRRGLPMPFGMKAEVNAGFAEAAAVKRKREKP